MKDINTSTTPSDFFMQTGALTPASNGRIFFMRNDSYYGTQLWVSNGSETGTTLIKNLGRSGSPLGINNSASNLTSVGQNLFYFQGKQLWITDGSIEGTALVSTINNLNSILNVSQLNDLLIFSISTSSGTEMWRSDGTYQGTFRLGSATPGFVVPNPVAFNNNLFFVANDALNGYELWKTDGTSAGTQILKNIMPGSGNSNPKELTISGKYLFFTAEDNVNGRELWKTDGTIVGTELVKDLNGGLASADISKLVDFNSKLYFVYNNSVSSLWSTDGTEINTNKVIDLITYTGKYTPTSSTLFFEKYEPATGTELWATDGTAGGTRLVKDILAGSGNGLANASIFRVNQDKLFFLAYSNSKSELWTSDGTSAGTYTVTNSEQLSGGVGIMQLPTETSNGLFFVFNDTGKYQNLWFTDTHTMATSKIMDFGSSPQGSEISPYTSPYYFNGLYYFTALDQIHGRELWRTNGYTAPELFADLSPNQTGPGIIGSTASKLFFLLDDGVHGTELWSTDGTVENTSLVKDINAGTDPTEISSQTWVIDNVLYFTAREYATGTELWSSDGTLLGTKIVKDVNPGVLSSDVDVVGQIGTKLLFFANNGVNGRELWITDGTESGTTLIYDINPGVASSDARYAVMIDNVLYFAANNGTSGLELWRSDGTSAGTFLLKDIAVGSTNGSPSGFTKFKNHIYFSAYNETEGWAVWRTDGTPSGTELYYDAIPGYQYYGGSYNYQVVNDRLVFWTVIVLNFTPYQTELKSLDGVSTPVNLKTTPYSSQLLFVPFLFHNELFFQLYDPSYGNEIWKTDGTANGTKILRDISLGTGSTYNDSFIQFADAFYFRCSSSLFSQQVWRSDGTECGTQQMTTDPAFLIKLRPLNNDRFFALSDHKDYGTELFIYDRLLEPILLCRQTQKIVFNTLPSKKYGDIPFVLNATSNAGLPIQYTLSNSDVISIVNGIVTILNPGKVIIKANQPGNEIYEPAIEVQQLLTVTKGTSTITFDNIPNKKYGDTSFELTALSNSSVPIIFSSSDPSIVSIQGKIVTILKPGSVSITASQEGNSLFYPATPVVKTLIIDKGTQSIVFEPFAVKTIGDTPFDLIATNSSGLLISYNSSNTAVATISGNIVTIIGSGSTTITATQSGDENYAPATPVQQILTVNKQSQKITFPPLPLKTYGDLPFNLTASSSSSLTVTYTSSNPTIASVTNNTITIHKAGLVIITASQIGDETFQAATYIEQVLTINKAKQSITFDPIQVSNSFSLIATASSGLPVTFVSSDPSIATIKSNIATITANGTVIITASQSGDENYNAAPEVSQILVAVLTGVESTKGTPTIYPNPGSDYLVVHTGNNSNKVINVFQIDGKIVETITSTDIDFVLNLSNYKSGLYIMSVVTEKQVTIHRFEKK